MVSVSHFKISHKLLVDLLMKRRLTVGILLFGVAAICLASIIQGLIVGLGGSLDYLRLSLNALLISSSVFSIVAIGLSAKNTGKPKKWRKLVFYSMMVTDFAYCLAAVGFAYVDSCNGTFSSAYFLLEIVVAALLLIDPYYYALLSAASVCSLLPSIAFASPNGLLPNDCINYIAFAILSVFAGFIASIYEMRTRRKLDKLQVSATIDELSGLGNRRKFDADIVEELRKGKPFVLAFGDLDCLKSINDREGHQAGDEVISKTGEAIGRRFEMAYRYGGDEFSIIGRGGLQKVETRLKATMDDLRAAGIEISFGYCLCDSNLDAADAIEEADKALYESKRSKSGMTYREAGK